MRLQEELKALGLNPSETTIYLALLEKGSLSVPQISEETKITRTNCYHILTKLETVGLISQKKQERRRVFFAKDPKAIMSIASRTKEVADRVLPDLQALFASGENKPQVKFFEGWEEVKSIYEKTLESEKIIAIGSTEKLSALELKFFSWYTGQLAKRKIIFNDILTHASKFHTAEEIKKVRGALHQIKFLPERFKDTPTDILIWDDHIALIALEEPVFGTVFTSKLFVQTFQMIFELLWGRL